MKTKLEDLYPGFGVAAEPVTEAVKSLLDHLEKQEVIEEITEMQPITVRLSGRTVSMMEEYAKRLKMQRSEMHRFLIEHGLYEVGKQLMEAGKLKDIEEAFNRKSSDK